MSTGVPGLMPAAGHLGATGISSAFGTFGELLQGVDDDGVDFLVTLPISCWSTAIFVTEPSRPGITVSPPYKYKAVALARAMLTGAGFTGGGRIELRSAIPEGKGLASSSADLVATARAVGNALRVELSGASIEALLRRIEPTDGVMYDAVTAFNHQQVRLRAVLGTLPPLTVVGLDEGGVVDTMRFNRLPKPFDAADRRTYTRLLAELTTAIAEGDLATVGRVATASAELNQKMHAKRTLSALRAACVDIGALGVVTAHSGTVNGLLLAGTDPRFTAKRAAAERACVSLAGNVSVYHTLPFDRAQETA